MKARGARCKRIIAMIKRLEEDVEAWTRKITDVVEKDNAPQLEKRLRHERAELVRRLGLLRRRPKIPHDDQPVITLSSYHCARGSTSATLRILKRGAESGACMCGKCDVFCLTSTISVSALHVVTNLRHTNHRMV